MKKHLIYLGSLSVMLPGCFQSAQNTASGQPNIIVILTDDLGYADLSCQGAEDFQTPNIDRLAASGVRFTAGYVTAPQCAPSRAGLLSGVSQSRFGFLDNSNQQGLPPADVVQTLPEQLKLLGYTTGIIGKWHIGSVGNAEEGWYTLPGNNPSDRGFDYQLTHHMGGAHYFPYRDDGKNWMTSRNREHRLEQKLEHEKVTRLLDDLPENTYLTDYFSEMAVDFVDRNKHQPWFLYLSYNAPHTPMIAKEEKLQKYSHIQDQTRRRLAAMMESLDDGVGLVLEALEKTGQTNRTLVFFLSDNGGPTDTNASRNDPFSGLKGDVHEGGIRVPFMLSWPGTIPFGKVLDEPVISLDILPTSLAAAGIQDIPAIHDGKNLLPWLKGEAPNPNEQLFWSWRSKSAIRIGSLKETRNGNEVKAVDGTTVPGHIFSDLKENPGEIPSKALQNEGQKKLLSDRLNMWLDQLKNDQKKLTPSGL
jgi:arylsulfatase A-like enzyme